MSSKLLQLSLYVVTVIQLMSFQVINVKAGKKQLESLITLEVTYYDCIVIIALFTLRSCIDYFSTTMTDFIGLKKLSITIGPFTR